MVLQHASSQGPILLGAWYILRGAESLTVMEFNRRSCSHLAVALKEKGAFGPAFMKPANPDSLLGSCPVLLADL